MQDPTLEDGRCPICISNYASCKFHREQDRIRDQRRTENMRRLLGSQHARELSAICLEFELESDEMGDAMDRAEQIYQQRNKK